jgi:hypothetical protein
LTSAHAANCKAAFESGTDRPRPLAVQPDGIPAELKALPQWVSWRYEWRGGKDGKDGKGGRWTKVPVNPSSGGNVKLDTPGTLQGRADA